MIRAAGGWPCAHPDGLAKVATGAGFAAKNRLSASRRRSCDGPPMAEVTDSSGLQPGYGIGALARRLGVAPATLRDWERRYGIGPGGRSPGGHRRYRPADTPRRGHMRRARLRG